MISLGQPLSEEEQFLASKHTTTSAKGPKKLAVKFRATDSFFKHNQQQINT